MSLLIQNLQGPKTLGPITHNLLQGYESSLRPQDAFHGTWGIKSEEQTARAATGGLWNLHCVACPVVVGVSKNELVKSLLTRIFMESRHIRGMSTAKAQLVLKLQKIIYWKCLWGGFGFITIHSAFGKKTGWEHVCVHRFTAFIVASVSTLVRPAGSENPETSGVIILNLVCSDLRLQRKWGKPESVMVEEVHRKGFDFSNRGEWVPEVRIQRLKPSVSLLPLTL